MLLGTLGASLLGNLLTGKGIITVGDGIVRAGEGSKKKLNSLLPFHPLTNIEISEYYSNEPRFNGVYSRDNLPKITKKGAYVINLDEYENTGTHWIALFIKTNEFIYFDSFGIEHIPKEINKFIGSNKKIKANIFRIQAYDSIMCGYFCIEFINYMLKGKTLLDYTNLFSPNDFKKNDRVIKRIFKNEYYYRIITCDCKVLLMIKIITCAHNILLMIKIIICAHNYMHFIKDGKRNLLFSMQKIY